MNKLLICVAGKNTISVKVLEYLLECCNERYDLCVTCNRTENGINGWQRSLRLFASQHDIQEVSLEDLYSVKNLIFLSMEYDRIIKPKMFLTDRLFNIHFSYLPEYKGMYTSALPILHGCKHSGVTFHRIDSGIDTGEIIDQEQIEIDDNMTCRELYAKYVEYGTRLVIKNIDNVIDGKEKSYPQNQKGSSYYSAKTIDYHNLTIDIKQTAQNIKNQLRAFNHREYQLPKLFGKQIISSRITNQRSWCKPGTVIFETDSCILMSTIDYNLLLYIDRLGELIDAIKKDELSKVYEICSIREHLNSSETNHGWTPLMVAIYNNKTEIAKYLIAMGADVFAKNYNGTNMLMYAKEAYIQFRDRELYDILINIGLSPFDKDYSNHDLLYYICDESIRRLLCEKAFPVK